MTIFLDIDTVKCLVFSVQSGRPLIQHFELMHGFFAQYFFLNSAALRSLVGAFVDRYDLKYSYATVIFAQHLVQEELVTINHPFFEKQEQIHLLSRSILIDQQSEKLVHYTAFVCQQMVLQVNLLLHILGLHCLQITTATASLIAGFKLLLAPTAIDWSSATIDDLRAKILDLPSLELVGKFIQVFDEKVVEKSDLIQVLGISKTVLGIHGEF